jgi:hypothetical protein
MCKRIDKRPTDTALHDKKLSAAAGPT